MEEQIFIAFFSFVNLRQRTFHRIPNLILLLCLAKASKKTSYPRNYLYFFQNSYNGNFF